MSVSWSPGRILSCKQQEVAEKMKSTEIDISNPNIIDGQPNRRRRSPIMVEFANPDATMVDIQQIMEVGMNIAKFKMAYSTIEEKISILSKVDRAAEGCAVKMGVSEWPVATCATLKTLVVKTGVFSDEFSNIIEKGSEVILSNDRKLIQSCRADRIFMDYAHMKDLRVGMEINIDQAEVVMVCTAQIDDTSIKCKVLKGGVLKDLRPVSIRNLVHTTPYITQKDIDILKFCLKYQVDMLVVYYARDGIMIKKIKKYISQAQYKPLILSSICNQQGLDNFDDILKESDGIVLSRDFLPYELDASKVFRMSQIQKWIAGKCLQMGKPLFLAGAVFSNALAEGRFTDHEMVDVSNALLDGVTGFVLKDCTNIKYTLSTIRVLNDICCTVEPLTYHKDNFWRIMKEPKIPVNAAEAAAISCVAVANQTKARVIIIPTVSGRTARILLWLRPTCIVITVSSMQNITRRLFTCRNIVPLVYKDVFKAPKGKKLGKVMERRVRFAAEFAVAKGWLVYGDMYVTLQRSSEGNPYCDMVRIWSVDFVKKLLIECNYDDDQFLPKSRPSEALETECQINPEDKDTQEKRGSKVELSQDDHEQATQVNGVIKEVEVDAEQLAEEPSQAIQDEATPTEATPTEATPIETEVCET